MSRKRLHWMTKGCLLLLVALLVALPWPQPVASAAAQSLRVVMDDNYPPYIFRDDQGNLQGILVDRWRLWEKKTGIKAELRAMDWDKALQEMTEGRADVIDTIFMNDERLKRYNFSAPYATLEVPIFFHRNISGIHGVKTLKGFKVGAKKGDNAVLVLREQGIENVAEYDSYGAIVQAAKQGEILVFVMDKPPGLYYLGKLGLQREFMMSEPIYSGQFHRAFPKGEPALLDVVEKGFGQISATEYKQIERRWRGADLEIGRIAEELQWALSLAVAVVLGLFAWNYTLKDSVRRKTAKLRAYVEAIPDQVFTLKRDGTFVDYKPSKEQPYIAPENFLGHQVTELFPPHIADRAMECIAQALMDEGVAVFEYNLSIGGRVEFYEARVVAAGKEEALAIVRNITERKALEQQLTELGQCDPLTGLYNRAVFEEEMRRYEGLRQQGAGIIIFDVDGLKIVNDSLGHKRGDELLKATARIISMAFGFEQRVCRIGGDEFALILSEGDEAVFEAACQQVREGVASYNRQEPVVPINLSMGYAVSRTDPIEMNAVFREADNRMYREKLHRRQSTRSAIVQALVQAMEARDFQTGGHCDRLQDLLDGFARQAKIPEANLNDVRLLARFHDIGKVGIPDKILFKPDVLTEEEQSIMRQHCEIGYRIAKAAPDLEPIADWILKHQEWWNGQGYPLGLTGEEIPLECRLLAIVDAFDAMTSDRPYRKAMSVQTALAEVRRQGGTQFDPALAAVFCAWREESGES